MLKLSKVNFSHDTKATLIDINLKVASSEFVAIIGKSGCGKSSLLNLIYGLLQEDSGSIFYNNEQLKGAYHYLIPGHHMMKYVPQEYHLMPYTTVYENIGEHISIQDDDRDKNIHRLLATVDMEAYTTRKVVSLSGG